MIFINGSAAETIRGADQRKLTTAIEAAVKKAGPAKPAFTDKGRTLGGEGGKGSKAATWNWNGLFNAILAFFGLYFTSLFAVSLSDLLLLVQTDFGSWILMPPLKNRDLILTVQMMPEVLVDLELETTEVLVPRPPYLLVNGVAWVMYAVERQGMYRVYLWSWQCHLITADGIPNFQDSHNPTIADNLMFPEIVT